MFRKLRISSKLLLTIFPLATLAIGVSVYLNNLYQERDMLEQAQVAARTSSDIIRESLVNMMVTRERVDEKYLVQLNTIPDIKNLHIHFTVDGLHLRSIYSTDVERMDRLRKREMESAVLSPAEQKVFETGEQIWQRNDTTFNGIIPFKADTRCQNCHGVSVGQVLGAAEMDISLTRISNSIKSNWPRSFFVYFVFTLLGAILSMVLYRVLVSRRLKNLVDATKLIGSGELDQPLMLDSSGDEIGELSSAIDAMRTQLKTIQGRLIHTERLSAIGQMASSIIHDFRSPMSTINLAIETLQQGHALAPEKTQQWYGMIRDSVHRMIVMAQELLDFSRGEMHLEKQANSVGEFVELLVQSVQPTLERNHVQLLVERQYTGNAVFDPDRMHRALVNIINNAQDAMPKGGMLRFVASRQNGSLLFSIADTGGGIPDEIREKIFEAFVTVGKKKGTGLGLAITKRIIDQHGGAIEVESERGKGTTFLVTIPTT
jgi:signal transduction histidine kinase